MKSKKLLFTYAVAASVFFLASCKKDNTSGSNDEIAVTTQSSQDMAISDNISEDANNSFMAAASTNTLMGARPEGVESPQTPFCGNVTVSQGAFPKTITIDFGTGSTCLDGITRSGSINIVLSDSVRKSGSTATLTFNNYIVGGYKREGTIVWTNTRTGDALSWTRVDSGKVTAPGGRYWYVTGTKNVVQTAGASTPLNITDDVFSITGSRTYTNANGVVRTATVVAGQPLEKATICANIDKGQLKIQGPNHYVIIDFGDGTCDALATYAIDGGVAHQFILR